LKVKSSQAYGESLIFVYNKYLIVVGLVFGVETFLAIILEGFKNCSTKTFQAKRGFASFCLL